jgi:hypothetical protein
MNNIFHTLNNITDNIRDARKNWRKTITGASVNHREKHGTIKYGPPEDKNKKSNNFEEVIEPFNGVNDTLRGPVALYVKQPNGRKHEVLSASTICVITGAYTYINSGQITSVLYATALTFAGYYAWRGVNYYWSPGHKPRGDLSNSIVVRSKSLIPDFTSVDYFDHSDHYIMIYYDSKVYDYLFNKNGVITSVNSHTFSVLYQRLISDTSISDVFRALSRDIQSHTILYYIQECCRINNLFKSTGSVKDTLPWM